MEQNTAKEGLLKLHLQLVEQIDNEIDFLSEYAGSFFIALIGHLKKYKQLIDLLDQSIHDISSIANDDKTLAVINEMSIIISEIRKFDIRFLSFVHDKESLMINYADYLENHKSKYEDIKTALSKLSQEGIVGLNQDNIQYCLQIMNQSETFYSGAEGIVVDVLKEFEVYRKHIDDGSKKMTRSLNECSLLMSEKFNKLRSYVPRLRQKKDDSVDQINSIIIDLQFHDIITQRLQHIKQAHQVFGNQIENDSSVDVMSLALIAELHREQILDINNNCQCVFEDLNVRLQNISCDTRFISKIGKRFVDFLDVFYNDFVVNVSENIAELIFLSEEKNPNQFHRSKADVLNGLICKIDEVYSQDLKIKIEDVVAEMNQNANIDPLIIDQMIAFCNSFEETKKGFESKMKVIHVEMTKESLHELMSDFIKISYDISSHIQEFIMEKDILNSKLSTNQELMERVDAEITDIVDKISKSDMFSVISNNLIQNYSKVSDSENDFSLSDINGSLKSIILKIEDLYTMESEREVMKRTFEGKNIIDITLNQESNMDDDNLELF